MTYTDKNADLRARKQVRDDTLDPGPTSGNGSSRTALRLVKDSTQAAEPAQQQLVETTSVGGHAGDIEDAVARHAVTASHPPTLVDAAMTLWPSREDVRHGVAGQVGSALAGLVQLAGLAACWATAHVFFATKARAALFALVLVATFSALAIALNV